MSVKIYWASDLSTLSTAFLNTLLKVRLWITFSEKGRFHVIFVPFHKVIHIVHKTILRYRYTFPPISVFFEMCYTHSRVRKLTLFIHRPLYAVGQRFLR